MKAITTEAFGKAMLVGEYAVLFGEKALVMAMPQKASCTFLPAAIFEFCSITNETKQHSLHPLFLAVKHACKQVGFAAQAGSYLLDTSAFFTDDRKLGIGSSAAAVVALCKAILAQHQIFAIQTIFDCSLLAHRMLANGLGSGADIAASTYGGVISYHLNSDNPVIEKIVCPVLTDNLIFIDTKRAQSTQSFIQAVLHLKDRDNQYIDDFCKTSSTIHKNITQNHHDLSLLISDIDHLYHSLKLLGEKANISIVSEPHQIIYKLAKSHGGSAKPSGSGGGDIAMALIPAEQRQNFLLALKTANFAAL